MDAALASSARLASGHLVRPLAPGDEAALEAFLGRRWESSLFLLANLAQAGLGPGSTLQHGAWAGAFAPQAPGAPARLEAVAGHFGFGAITLQAADPALLGPVARLAAALSGREVRGIGGPWDQVVRAQAELGRAGDEVMLAEPEVLFVLELDALVAPAALSTRTQACRRAGASDLPVIEPWRADYLVETGLEPPGAPIERVRDWLLLALDQRALFVLEDAGRPVACSAFNAVAGDVVQIGGVFTPPALRSRGYGRAVVAGSLLLARAEGARRSVLFTPQSNRAAQRAYAALGYRAIGEYGLIRFRTPRAGP